LLGVVVCDELWLNASWITFEGMKFALLGADEESLSLAQAAVQAGNEVVWAGDIAPAQDGWDLPWLPADDLANQWETLLDHHTCEAVLVGRGLSSPELRADQINQLIKNGVAVLATYPLVDSVLSFYEIDMVRCESRAILHHFNPLAQPLPAFLQCAHWVADGHPELGQVEQVIWHRPLAERTQQQALWHFARDVELLGQVAGRLNRLGALGSPDEGATYAGLSVQLLGHSKIPVRWEVGPAQQSTSPRLKLIAASGTLDLEFDETGQPLRFAIDQQTESIEPVDPYAMALNRFVEAVEFSDGAGECEISTWPSALHAMELADTIEISLRRGRMIDVHDQQLSEDLAFKGTMSAAGCGILMILPPLLLVAGWLAGVFGLPIAHYWPHALLALLTVFLVFQTLPKLLLNPRPSNSSGDSSPALPLSKFND